MKTIIKINNGGTIMKKMNLIFTSLISIMILACNVSLAQIGNNWYFGDKASIQFPGLIALSDGVMSTAEDCATISDNNSKLLFDKQENLWYFAALIPFAFYRRKKNLLIRKSSELIKTPRHFMGGLMVLCFLLASIGKVYGQSQPVTVTITSDNAYVFGFGNIDEIKSSTYYSPGVCNTRAQDIFSDNSGAEHYNLYNANLGGYIYIAAWADNSTYQGLIAQFAKGSATIVTSPNPSSVNTNVHWEVYATNFNLDPFPIGPLPSHPHWIPQGNANCPTLEEINTQISLANSGPPTSVGWQGTTPTVPGTLGSGQLFFGPDNSTVGNPFPPGIVLGIDPNAHWMWYYRSGTTSPFIQPPPPGEYFIFRIGPIGPLLTECPAADDSLYTKIWSDITYTTDMIWDGKMFVAEGVTVTVDNALLDITNVDVVFDQCAGIRFVNGGYLRANNSVFRPCWIKNTWKGLHFLGGENDSIMVNECTFKNAEVALYFQDTADAVISGNLFSNCNFGIRVEGNNNFNHPITGNQFVTDQFFPDFDECGNKYDFVNNYSTYGIYSSQSRFLYQLSQNKFINSKGNTPNTYGIYQVAGGGIFSENIFTDLFHSVFLHSQEDYSCIENNEIEVKLPAMYNPSIRIYSCQGAIVEVNNNEIWNNYNQNVGWIAIYADYSSNVSIVNNQIDGFNYGIVSLYNQKCQISNNEINDCQTGGIIIYEQTYNKSYITCNTIKMKNYDNSTGLMGYGLSSQSEISSNCITDCRVSMEFRRRYGVTFPPLPKIRNNFLYNYNFVGINVANLSGNIGTLTDPGLNTLWSNNNASRDINSNTNITVADNFGMFNISWPQVQIVSNNPYHSTASCARQIFNMPSQGQLNVSYTCDHFPALTYLLTGGGGLFYLSPDYQESLKSSTNQYNDASMILANYDNSDLNLLNEIIDLTTLSENEKALLRYNFYYRNADYQNARMHLNHFNPTSTDEEDFKTLRLYDLDIIGNGMGILSENDLEILRSIQDKKPEYSNFATSILNNSSTYTNYKIEEITVEDVEISGDVKRIENGESFLHIYPNPVTNTVFIELINNNSQTSTIELFDMTGKLVTEYTINFVAGGIELDMQKLNEGLYFITLTDPTSGFIQKGKMVKINN